MKLPTRCIAFTGAVCTLVACSQDKSSSATGGPSSSSAAGGSASDWIANATTACEKYLTPDVVATIWAKPAGRVKQVDTRSATAKECRFQADSGFSITIALNTAGPESFDGGQKYLVDPLPLPNVGDKASITGDGIVAVKGPNRTCHIDAYSNSGSIQLSREALAQKFGEICNKLFALP
jgi:hypothetical protein